MPLFYSYERKNGLCGSGFQRSTADAACEYSCCEPAFQELLYGLNERELVEYRIIRNQKPNI